MAFKNIAEDPKYKGVLPSEFLHGYASAAYQIEGAASAGGRGPCIFDVSLKDFPDTGEVACKSYHMWRDDVELLRQYGARSYRFSISWTRIKPLGGKNDPLNQEGIEYYHNLINALLDAGIEPTVTLFHYDVPQALQERYRGFAAVDPTQLIEDFVDYARTCFSTYGDRVKRWLTINEPYIFTISMVDHIKDWANADLIRVGHNSLLTHAYATDLYRREFQQSQKGQIGIALNNEWVEPIDDSPEAIAAANLSRGRTLGWFADPIFKGTQTTAWDAWGDLFLRFSDEEMKLLKGSADFFSINHYGTMYATGKPFKAEDAMGWQTMEEVNKSWEKDGKLIGKRGENGHPHMVGWGFRNLLIHCWENYAKDLDLPIYIYENGFPVEDEQHMPLEQILDDKDRQEFYSDYIRGLCDAVLDHGAKIQGYHCWSLLDNLEWVCGYGPRFGVTYIDKENGFKRIPKNSAKFVENIWKHVVSEK
ncbi:hypothetical protein V2G26_018773 [Clonostachys chloroleuca]